MTVDQNTQPKQARKQFPVLSSYVERKKYPLWPKSVPWGLVAPHEARALVNHTQTLERLAQRGGLALCEMIAVIEDRAWHPIKDEEALAQIAKLVNEYNEALENSTD